MMDRRTVLSAMGASAVTAAFTPAIGKEVAANARSFPKGFLWGVATAGHQIEGNNVASDLWLVEHVKPTLFAEPSGDACNSFELWPTDLDLVRNIGLNAYRFSLEWARIEPEPGAFSIAMLDHYKALIEGCRTRGITPVVTFSHGTVPRWFAARGGWTTPESPNLFANFCDRAARHLAGQIGYATTLNEPNAAVVVASIFPPQFLAQLRAMNTAAGRACNVENFRSAILSDSVDVPAVQSHLLAAHKAGRAAIKAARSDLPVGFNLSIQDDEAVGPNSLRDAKRAAYYGPWLDVAKGDDFMGVQNYVRVRWGDKGALPPPPGAKVNLDGGEVYPASLANSVRYAHAATGVPIMVTEHGVFTKDDTMRAEFIPAALIELQRAVTEGVPVMGYLHWTLIDNFEWFFGFGHTSGLCSLDRATFKRTPKPSAAVLGAIAKRNAV
jgi:beta-glucosidase